MPQGGSRVGGVGNASGSASCSPTLTPEAGTVIPYSSAAAPLLSSPVCCLSCSSPHYSSSGGGTWSLTVSHTAVGRWKLAFHLENVMQAASRLSVFRSGALGSFCRKSGGHTPLPYLLRATFLRTDDHQSSTASFPSSPTRNSTILPTRRGTRLDESMGKSAKRPTVQSSPPPAPSLSLPPQPPPAAPSPSSSSSPPAPPRKISGSGSGSGSGPWFAV